MKLVEETKPDVVLVDLLLPDMSGLELTRLIKNKTDSKVFRSQKSEVRSRKSEVKNLIDYLLLPT